MFIAMAAGPRSVETFGDKLLIEVDLFGSNTHLADSMTYITIGTG
jgi:hypothetical protein